MMWDVPGRAPQDPYAPAPPVSNPNGTYRPPPVAHSSHPGSARQRVPSLPSGPPPAMRMPAPSNMPFPSPTAPGYPQAVPAYPHSAPGIAQSPHQHSPRPRGRSTSFSHSHNHLQQTGSGSGSRSHSRGRDPSPFQPLGLPSQSHSHSHSHSHSPAHHPSAVPLSASYSTPAPLSAGPPRARSNSHSRTRPAHTSQTHTQAQTRHHRHHSATHLHVRYNSSGQPDVAYHTNSHHLAPPPANAPQVIHHSYTHQPQPSTSHRPPAISHGHSYGGRPTAHTSPHHVAFAQAPPVHVGRPHEPVKPPKPHRPAKPVTSHEVKPSKPVKVTHRPPGVPVDLGEFEYSRCTGRKKALCIGINYAGTEHELKGCINDATNVVRFLNRYHHFKTEDIVLLTDDARNSRQRPTRDNILDAMRWLVKGANKHDSLFFHYSGHGGQTPDLDGDEIDGLDEVIFPLDHRTAGHIVDDEMHAIMVKPLPKGCRLTALFDSCHSGSILDLPYIYHSDGRIKDRAVAEKLRALKYTPADVVSWSGCKDSETSADTVEDGLAVGAMSNAFIAALKANPDQSYLQLLKSIRAILKKNYSQKAQLSSSHKMDMKLKFVM